MKITWLIPIAPLILSGACHAEWFYRGTSNTWNATQMDLVSTNRYQTCQTFANGDGGGGPRFKIDRHGDWAESYPTVDHSANSHTSYLIDFDTSTQAITTTEVASCNTSSGFPSLHFRGTPNAWENTLMQEVSEGIWQVTINFDGQAEQRFKFDILGDWSQNYGDDNSDGQLEFAGSDIFTSITGTYLIEVNEADLSYTLTPDGSPPPPPADTWYFRGTSNSWATTVMVSTDSVNFCTQQSFASGDNGGGPRFKVDHFGDWTESYPAQDYSVNANTTYDVCFNADTKVISVASVAGADSTPPVVTVDPAPGQYAQAQSISLNVSDNQDANPLVYFTTDGTTPTATSTAYTGQVIQASDVTSGADLTLKTLAIDASGNQQVQSFAYFIGEIHSGAVDFREETIYFLLTARFYDGDSGNNYYNRDRIKIGDPHWRGDFKGLIDKLDYIQDLGFTAIWITPPVENRSGLDYHGYHAYDFYKVDPRLESDGATYQDLIHAAHAKGMKIIQDVVINHSGQYGLRDQVWIDHLPIKYYVPAGAEQGQVSNNPYFGNLGDYQSANRDDNDNSVAPQWFKDRHSSDPEGIVPLVDPKTGETIPKAGYDPNRFFGIDAQGLDPNWYHLDGFMAGGDWENPTALQNKHLAGDTIDLATERQNVKDYLNGAIQQYLDMGVDAIRVDTVKHIERDELLEYVNNWKAHKPGLFVFGENLVKGSGLGSELANDNASAVIRPWWYTRTTQDPSNPNAGGDSGFSVLDFSVFSTFRDNVTRGSFGGIGGMLGWDWIYGDASQLVTFFQNHDVGPDNDFKYRYGGEQANAAMVYNLLWTNRGIPTLYYGEEIMFQAGTPQDIANANDTIDQTGRAYFGEHLDNLAATQSHPLYQHIKRLNQVRKAIPALQKAQTTQVNEWGAGMSFVRDYSQGGSYAVVGLASGTSQNITVSGVQNGTYTDAITGAVVNVSNGNLSFNVKPYSAGIYVLNGPGKVGVDGVYLR